MAGWQQSSPRDVRRDPLFDSAIAAIEPNARRLDDQLRGIEWAIATAPYEFPQVQGTSLHLIKTDPWPGAPPLRVYFTIDDEHTCTLRWVEIIEGPAAGEDFSD